MTTGNQLLEGELNRALQGYGRGHGNHSSWFDGQRTAYSKLECENGIRVSVADSVASTIESAHIVDSRTCANKVRLWGCTAGQVGCQRSIQRWSNRLFCFFVRGLNVLRRARIVRQGLLLR